MCYIFQLKAKSMRPKWTLTVSETYILNTVLNQLMQCTVVDRNIIIIIASCEVNKYVPILAKCYHGLLPSCGPYMLKYPVHRPQKCIHMIMTIGLSLWLSSETYLSKTFGARVSIVYENILRFSRVCLRSTLTGNFQSCENEKKCATCRLFIIIIHHIISGFGI